MKRRFLLGLPLISLISFLLFSGAQDINADSKDDGKYILTKQWETEKVFKVPESVLYDESTNLLYVSNTNARSTEKDGQGFISKLTLDGKVVDLKWAEGLDSPKGSAIYGNKFYVADRNRVVEIDLKNGKVLARYPAEGAISLNDIDVDREGNVYVSNWNRKNGAIYRLSKGRVIVWLKGPEIIMPNGLHMEEERLMFGNFGDLSLKAVYLADKRIVTVAKIGSGIDGLRSDGKGNYIFSDWRGKTSLVTPAGQKTILLDTTSKKINSADIEYIKDKRLLLIPTFFDNRVMAYKLEDQKKE